MIEQLAIIITADFISALLLSLLGGIGSYLHGYRNNDFKHSFLNLFTELVLATTTGLAIMYIGQWKELSPALVSVLILMLTNNGSESILLLRGIFTKTIQKIFGV